MLEERANGLINGEEGVEAIEAQGIVLSEVDGSEIADCLQNANSAVFAGIQSEVKIGESEILNSARVAESFNCN